MEKKYKFITFNIFVFVLFFFITFLNFYSGIVFASEKEGTIDTTYKYGKLVDKGGAKINFGIWGVSKTALRITDSSLSGFSWGPYIGSINFSPKNGGVRNDGEGNLLGYATSEFGGWINFSGVTINKDGEFLGYALTENLGKIIFNCVTDNSCASDDFKVLTDWRPISVRDDGTPYPILPPFVDIPPSKIIEEKDPSDNPDIIKDTNIKTDPIKNTGQYANNNSTKNENKEEIKKIIIDVNSNQVSTAVEQNTVSSTTGNKLPVVFVSQEDVTSFPSIVKNTTKEIKKEALNIAEDSVVNISTKTITTAGIAGGGTVIISSLVTNLLSFSEFFLTIFRLWSIILLSLGLKKKRESWGTVYDSVTKQPLDPAYVVLKDKFGKVVATSITDLDGRYGFMVKPGIYHIVAKKTNYIFPSKKLHGKASDELYDNLYFGEDININNEKVINRNIPMDEENFDWNEFAKRKQNLLSFHSKFSTIFAKISKILFFVGMIFSICLFVLKPDVFNVAILGLYIVLLILRKLNKKAKSYGTILDKKTGLPLSFAIVRVFLKGVEKKEIFHRVTDEFGHYYCLLPKKGEYFITVEKKNIDESYSNIFTSNILDTKVGILKQDFIL